MVCVLHGKQLQENEDADAFAKEIYEAQCHSDNGGLRFTKFIGVTAEFESKQKLTRSYRWAWCDWDPETLRGSEQIVVTRSLNTDSAEWKLKCFSTAPTLDL